MKDKIIGYILITPFCALGAVLLIAAVTDTMIRLIVGITIAVILFIVGLDKISGN